MQAAICHIGIVRSPHLTTEVLVQGILALFAHVRKRLDVGPGETQIRRQLLAKLREA